MEFAFVLFMIIVVMPLAFLAISIEDRDCHYWIRKITENRNFADDDDDFPF